MNDLFELQPYLRFKGEGKKKSIDKRKQFRKIRTEVADTYGMVCFSSNWQEPIMWGHYADCGKGIVLGFEIMSMRFNVKEVQYPSERVEISLDPGNVIPSAYIDAVGFVKYQGWSYENEHRFFVKLDECVCIEGNYFLRFGDDLKLKTVIIGPEHQYTKKDYKKKAKYITDLVKQNDAELMVTRPEFGGYRVVRCGSWTPRLEELLNS